MSFYEEFLEIFAVLKIQKPYLNFTFKKEFEDQGLFTKFKDVESDLRNNLKKLYFVTCSIKNILKESLSSKMEIPLSAILTIFQAFTNLFKFKAQNDKSLDFIVPELFQNIFSILESLVITGKRSIIPFTKDFNYIVNCAARWLEKFDCKSHLELRTKFNSMLSVYFECLTFNHNFDDVELKALIKIMLLNIQISDSSLKIDLKNAKESSGKDVVDVLKRDSFEDKKALVDCTEASIKGEFGLLFLDLFSNFFLSVFNSFEHNYSRETFTC